MKLFQVSDAIEVLLGSLDAWDESTGALNQWAEDQFAELTDEAGTVGLDIAAYIVGLECESDAVARQAKVLKSRSDGLKSKAGSLKGYLDKHLSRTGLDSEKLSNENVTIAWRKGTSVEIVELRMVPEQYFVTKPPEVSRKAIKDALKAGTSVPGAKLVERRHIQVK